MSERYLFVDDREIDSLTALRRVWHAPEKLGTVLEPDRPWEDKTGTSCPMVAYDPDAGLYKMWYWNSKGGLADLYATSPDGLHWDKPILGLVDIDGSTENNKVKTPGRVGPGAVFRCPEAAAAEGEDKLYRTVSWIPGGEWSQRYLPIFSADGLTWNTAENADKEPGVSGKGVGDTGTFLVADEDLPPRRAEIPGRYVAFPRVHVQVARWGRRAVGMTFCNTTHQRARIMLDWPQPVLVLAPDLVDDEMARERIGRAHAQGILQFSDPADHHCEFYTMQPWAAGGGWLGAVYVFDVSMDMGKRGMWNQHGMMETQLVWSRDLVHWERVMDRKPWICRGEPGEQDCAMVHYASVPVRAGSWMYQYYSAGNLPHPSVDQRWLVEQRRLIEAGRRQPLQTVAAVRFRPEGYVSLDAGARPGRLVSPARRCPSGELSVNAACRDGELTVELLSENGRPLAEYGKAVIRGDEVACRPRFARPLDALAGRTLKLRFVARNASLYGWGWGDP